MNTVNLEDGNYIMIPIAGGGFTLSKEESVDIKEEAHKFLSDMMNGCTVRIHEGSLLFEKEGLGTLFGQYSKKHVLLVQI